jgi:N-acetylneuraminate synthase
MPIELIAEIGINHNADMTITKRLIDAVFATGWHVAKFQKRTPELCVPLAHREQPKQTPWGQMTYLEYKQKMEFGQQEYDYINKYCADKPVLWTASVWDIPSLYFLVQYQIAFIKIPSAKLTDSQLLEACAKSGIPIYLSTGMSTTEEIDEAVNLILKYSNERLTLFHTNSTYPCPVNELNLRCIPWLKERYGQRVGYSGHEIDLEPSVAAAVLGAEVIERHITLDHRMWGSDQAASLEVHAMDMLRKRLDDVPAMLGDGVKRVYDGEQKAKEKLRG